MLEEHRPGEKAFVDFSGDGIPWIDPLTGEVHCAQRFVGALGASGYTFATACPTQELHDWIECQARMLEFFGGVPAVLVPDQPKSLVARACRYDPEINPTYLEFARHYGTCVVSARPRRPKDKAKAEAAVLLAERWTIAVLRDRTFYSVDEIVKAIAEVLGKLNDRELRKLGRSCRELFFELDKPALKPLPENPYEFAEWKIAARVNLDYHVEFAKNFYSVPFQHARERVDIRVRARTVEVFLRSRRVASHRRRFGTFEYSTLQEHMPRSHREHVEWTPSRILSWAGTVGPSTAEMVERIMTERPHPEQGFRACLGILRLEKRYSGARLEKACARALACRSHSYRAVESILKNGLEDKPLPAVEAPPLPFHENVRGPSYFNGTKGNRHVDPADDRETLRAQAPRNGRGAGAVARWWLPVRRSPRSPRHPRRRGMHEPREPAAHAPAPGSPVPRRRHRRGDRLPAPPQAPEVEVPRARLLPLGGAAPERDHHRPDGHREDLPALRAREQRLSRRVPRHLCSRPSPLR